MIFNGKDAEIFWLPRNSMRCWMLADFSSFLMDSQLRKILLFSSLFTLLSSLSIQLWLEIFHRWSSDEGRQETSNFAIYSKNVRLLFIEWDIGFQFDAVLSRRYGRLINHSSEVLLWETKEMKFQI